MKVIVLLLLVCLATIHAQQPELKKPILKGKYSSQEPKEPTILDEFKERVVTLSAKNFDKIVLDRTKDVFVEFYANW